MTVYLDVLLLSNLWADYALLLTAARLCHMPLSGLRSVLSALLGACFSLVILLPPMPGWLCLVYRIGTGFLLCLAAFGRRQLLRRTACLLGISTVFCGAVTALSQALQPVGFYQNNSQLYMDVSLLTLLGGTAAAASVMSFLERRAARLHRSRCRLHLRIRGRDYDLPALADTGNTLRDAFSGKPVAVCPAGALHGLSAEPDALTTALSGCRGFRLLPVETVAGRTLLPAFQPEQALLDTGAGSVPVELLVAVTPHSGAETPVILPACVVP